MKILVTGSSGLIGSCISEKLRGRHEVFGLHLKPSPYTNLAGDILDYEFIEKIVGRVDAVIHCAAQTSVAAQIRGELRRF